MFEMPLHPAVVHVPVALAILMPFLTLGLLVAWWRDWLPGRAWAIAVALQAVLVVGAVTAVQTGEAEEERVEEVVDHDLIEEHEEGAKLVVWSSGGALIVMLLPLFLPGERRKKLAAVAASGATVAVMVLALGVGKAGGELVYEHGAADAHGDDVPSDAQGHEEDDDD